MIKQDRRGAQANAAEESRIDRRFKKWLRDLHRRDNRLWVRVRTPKAQRIPLARKKPKRDNRNIRALPAYRRAIIDKLGRRGIFLDFEYDGAARNPFGVIRRRTEYPFNSESVQRDGAGRPVFVSNMGRTPEEICEAADALEGVMRAERANAKLSVNAILQLPFDASLEQQLEITRRYCSRVFGPHDIPYVAVLHKPDPDGDQRNYHVHITFAFRQMVRVGDHQWAIGANLRTDLDTADEFAEFRRVAAEIMTKVMRKAGHNVTYTHLSNAARGLPIIPQKELDKAQVNQVRRGSYVGANAFNAREIAKGEQALERLTLKNIPPLKTVGTVSQVTPISLPHRRASIELLTIAKPHKRRGIRPWTKRTPLAGIDAVKQPGDTPLIAAKALPGTMALLVRTKSEGTPPPLAVVPVRPVTSASKITQKWSGVIGSSALATHKTAVPVSTIEPVVRVAIPAPPSISRRYLLAKPGQETSNRSQPGMLIRIGRVSIGRRLMPEPALASYLPKCPFLMPRRTLAVPHFSTSVWQHGGQVLFGRPDLLMPVMLDRMRDAAIAVTAERFAGRIQTIARPSWVEILRPLVSQSYSNQRPIYMPSIAVAVPRTPPSPLALPELVEPIVVTMPVPAVVMVPARTCPSNTRQLPTRANTLRISQIDRRQPKLLPFLANVRARILEQDLVLPTVSLGVARLPGSGSKGPVANVQSLPMNVVLTARLRKIRSRLQQTAPPVRPISLHSLPQRLCKAQFMPAAPPRPVPTITAFRSSKLLQTIKLEMPAHTTAGFAHNFDRIRSTREQLGNFIATQAPQFEAVPANGTSMSSLKENRAAQTLNGENSTADSAKAVHQSGPAQRMTKEEIHELLKPRRVGPDGIFHIVDKPVGDPTVEAGARQIGIPIGRPANPSHDIDEPPSDNSGRAPASFAPLGRSSTEATAAPHSDAHDLLVQRFEMARSDDERRASAPAIRADKIAFERMTQRKNPQWISIDREFRDEQRNAAGKSNGIRE